MKTRTIIYALITLVFTSCAKERWKADTFELYFPDFSYSKGCEARLTMDFEKDYGDEIIATLIIKPLGGQCDVFTGSVIGVRKGLGAIRWTIPPESTLGTFLKYSSADIYSGRTVQALYTIRLEYHEQTYEITPKTTTFYYPYGDKYLAYDITQNREAAIEDLKKAGCLK